MAQQQAKNKSIYQKLVEIQAELKAPKNQYNNFGGYYYRSAEDIIDAVKPLLYERGLYQTITDEVVNVGDRYYVKATVTVSDGENSISVDAYARETEDKKGADPSQITGAASSYARKYSMNGMYAIDDNKDSDATNTHGKEEKQNKTSNVKAAAKENAQNKNQSENDDDLTDAKSQAAYQVALQKFKDCTSKEEITKHGPSIMQQAHEEGLKQGDKNKLTQEINQLYDTLPEKAGDGQQEGSTKESPAESGQSGG